MTTPDNLRHAKLALANGTGDIPALGFGTPIPDPVTTRNATKAASEAGFRCLDTAERYRTEKEVRENFDIAALPEDAVREINERIATRVRFNSVVETGAPGFIPRGK